ncbi:MAG: elongation factor P maturation arginine rhamnosyltransferase EarP [Candidatus Dechloromonas phosphoritropha]
MQLHWDIFCHVVDNHGDIGVCWRLARQLAAEHGKQVRLWLDDVDSLRPLCPAVDVAKDRQLCQGVEIHRWAGNVAVDRVGEVIIEGFGCKLPEGYLRAMAQAATGPCWINLEYLSAESWIEGCHGMASPHPTLPLTKYFYFPGFPAATGGLLRENDLLARRDAAATCRRPREGIDISLFCYDNAPVGELLEVMTGSPSPVRVHVASGKPLTAVQAHCGGNGPWQFGELRVIPFDPLPLDEYDKLLWRCDINFVRGEDSFIRAQWAGKAFVWQPYVQEAGAHLVKLDAFLGRYTAGMNHLAATAAVNLFKAWNSADNLRRAWADFLAARMEITAHTRRWSQGLAERPDLCTDLVKFCATKV